MRTQRLFIATAMLAFSACKLWEPSIVCPDGTRCPDGKTCAARQNICIMGTCGNALLDPGELCDDGNAQSNDGCSDSCMSRERCGDGVKEERFMEACDDGNTVSGDGCSSDCRSNEKCGNGIVDPQTREACDHGNSSDRMGCSSDCMDLCGDGIIGATEQCDPKAAVPLFCADDPKFDMGRLDCDADCEYTMDACVSFGLREIPEVPPAMPSEQPIQLNAIWSNGSGNGYGVGNKGTIVWFGREGWGKEDVPSDFSEVDFYGIWGAGSEGPVYVVGDSGMILTRGVNGAWEPVKPSSAPPVPGGPSPDAGPPPDPGPPPSLKGVWGYTVDGGTVAFAVGDDCTIRKLADGTWTAEQVPQGCHDSLQAVSGNGRHIYAVAQNTADMEEGPPVILRHDGAAGWERLVLYDVSATSYTDIWVGSDDTFILAGERIFKCEEVAPPDAGASAGVPSCARMDYSGGTVGGIWGSSPHDLFAVAGATVFHSNGFLQDEWTAKHYTTETLVDVNGSSAFDIFVASNTGVLHGALPWRKMDSVNDDLLDVWADETTVYAAGETGLFWLDDDGAWERVGGAQGEIYDLWGIDGSHVFAVGHGFDSVQNTTVGRLFLCDKDQCSEQEPPPDTISPYLRGVWASHQNKVFVVGDDGATLRYDFDSDADSDSGEWAVIAMAEPDDTTDLYDIWGSDTENLFAVGSAGTIFRYDEETWQREPLPLIYNEATMLAIWGASADNIFAVGQYGTILHYKGLAGGWEPMASPTFATLYDIGGIVIDEQIKVFAVGYDGLVLYYDGVAWSEIKTGTTDDFEGVWVTPTDAFMVADSGNTYRLRHSRIEAPSLE